MNSERKDVKTVDTTLDQMNPLYLCIWMYSGPVSLEGANPWPQRPKGKSLPTHCPHPLRRGTADAKGEGCPGGAPQALSRPKWCPPAMAASSSLSQLHPAGEEAAIAAAWAEVFMLPMVPSRTPKCHKPCFPWKLITSWRNLLQSLTDSLNLWAAWWRPGWWDHSGHVPCPHAGSRSALATLGFCTRSQSISDHPHPKPFKAGSFPLTQWLDW